jgi:hypothetical protein
MKALAESTAEHPAHVRVMFYGQSITAQNWTKIIQRQLETQYPTVHFEFQNSAIGGYQSPLLVRTAEHDLYPWYPDLLFFHNYGPTDKYEEMVRKVRERTSAEIILWTSHIAAQDNAAALSKQLDDRSLRILEIAEQYHCMKINLREKWCDYLNAGNISNTNLLKDKIHLNPAGCDLYARFIGEELVRRPELGDNPSSAGTITAVATDAPAVNQNKNGQLTLTFNGNRVVAVSDGTGDENSNIRVLLDGQPMDDMKALWKNTRSSLGPAGIWMPAINHISFEKTPVKERWTLTCLPDSTPDGKRIHFKVQGTVTGEDGEGWSTERFVSRSGRVVIEPSDWQIGWILEYKKATLPTGFRVNWDSYPLFTSTYHPAPSESRTVLVQGCANGPHTLTFESEKGDLGIRAFVVNAPAAE